jgi:hypothetical protein
LETIDTIVENIEAYVDITTQLEMACKYYKIALNASPLYNFRDALSHYILRYEATTDEEKIAQETSITEHLFRGTKVAYVLIVYETRGRTSNALKKANSRRQAQDFRRLLHGYKKLELGIRRNTESTVIRSLTPFVVKLNDIIEETKRVFEQYGLFFIIDKKYPMPVV